MMILESKERKQILKKWHTRYFEEVVSMIDFARTIIMVIFKGIMCTTNSERMASVERYGKIYITLW